MQKQLILRALAGLTILSTAFVVPTDRAKADDPFALVDTCSVWMDVQENGAQSSDDLVRSLTCQFYVSGFFDGYATNDEYSYSTAKPREFEICFPEAVTIGDLIQSFVRYTKTKDLSVDASQHTILYMSMVSRYPCGG